MCANSGSLSIACLRLGPRKLSVIRSSGVSAIQGLLLSIEVNGRAIRTFRIVRYIVGVRYSGVSVKRGSTVFKSTLHAVPYYTTVIAKS